MKNFCFCIIAIIIFFSSVDIANASGNKERYIEKKGNFSITIPEKWEIFILKEYKYKLLKQSEVNNSYTPLINFADEAFEGSIDEYTEYFMEELEKLLVENIEYLFFSEIKTSNGLNGKLIVITTFQQEMLLQLNYFIFQKNENEYLIITCSSLANESAKYIELFVNTVRTLEWIK